MPTVYIIQSQLNQSYYIGSTDNLARRLQEHNSGKTIYTKHLAPWNVVFFQEYPTQQYARKVEYWLKQLKSREILQKIIQEGVIKKVVQ